MEKKLLSSNILNYEFIDAIDGIDPQIINLFECIKKNTNTEIITTGHFACLLSHIKAIKMAIKRNYQNIMILEDDTSFCDNFLIKLNQLEIPDFDILYLGGIISKKKIYLNNWSFGTNRIMGAYGYILSEKIYKDVISKLEKYEEYVDVLFIKEIQPYYKTILLDDFVLTDLSSSDTSTKSKKLIKHLNYIK